MPINPSGVETVPYLFNQQSVGSANFPAQLDADLNDLAAAITQVNQGTAPGTNQRLRLTTATTFYIATNGSDANNGTTSGTPWLTFAHAMAVLSGQLDFGSQAVTLQAVAGHATFTTTLPILNWSGGGSFIFDGGGGSISPTNADAISLDASIPGPFTYRNVALGTSGATGYCLRHFGAGAVHHGTGVTYNVAASGHLFIAAGNGATLRLDSGYTIAGGAPIHLLVGAGAVGGDTTNITVTLSGSPAFPSGFIFVNSGYVFISAVHYSGAVGAGTGLPAVTNNGILSNGKVLLPGETSLISGTNGGQRS